MERGRTLFVQIIEGERCQQGSLDEAGRPTGLSAAPLPQPYLREQLGRAARILRAHVRFLRVLVRLLYLSPILIIPKCVAWWPAALWVRGSGDPYGDWITVGFVALVVLFFAALAVYVLLFVLAGPPSARRCGWRFRAPGPSPERGRPEAVEKPYNAQQLQRLLEDSREEPLPGPLVVRGQVRAFNAEGQAPLLVDLWSETGEGTLLRVTSARPFILEGDRQPPVVVGAGVPLLITDYAALAEGPDEESLALRRLAESLRLGGGAAVRAALVEGSWLELHAARYQRVPDLRALRLDGLAYTPEPGEDSGSPYRDVKPRPALAALATEERPIQLRPDVPAFGSGEEAR